MKKLKTLPFRSREKKKSELIDKFLEKKQKGNRMLHCLCGLSSIHLSLILVNRLSWRDNVLPISVTHFFQDSTEIFTCYPCNAEEDRDIPLKDSTHTKMDCQECRRIARIGFKKKINSYL